MEPGGRMGPENKTTIPVTATNYSRKLRINPRNTGSSPGKLGSSQEESVQVKKHPDQAREDRN